MRNMTVGANIKYYREKANLSQQKLANAIDKSKQTVSLYERDKFALNSDNIIAICDELNITPNQLLGYE